MSTNQEPGISRTGRFPVGSSDQVTKTEQKPSEIAYRSSYSSPDSLLFSSKRSYGTYLLVPVNFVAYT
jgi:hypothetical protein